MKNNVGCPAASLLQTSLRKSLELGRAAGVKVDQDASSSSHEGNLGRRV
jgi:hypothetical protein